MKMIFIFIDGFGLGREDKLRNPLAAARTPAIDHLFKNGIVIPTDTTLDVQGLPQSATGQTSIFTGVNAAKILGRHLNAQPTDSLKQVIYRNNLFKELVNMGFKVTNSNVYRQEYLDKMFDPGDRKHKPSVTSVMTFSAGLKFRTIGDYKIGRGVYHDITGKILKESGYDVDIITPAEAAQRLYNVSRDYNFTLFEHFITDIIGHKMDMKEARRQIELLDEFLRALMELIDIRNDIIFITSDHGNIEDMTVKTHTMNRVPTILLGNVPKNVDLGIESLVDIMPAVLNIFRSHKNRRDE